MTRDPGPARHPLLEVALVFARLGATSFGGPAAHIALMEDEIVRRRAWITREQFLDLIGAANLIPGPNSTEVAIHLGYVRAGLPGLVAAGAAFIIPAALSTAALAWAYVRFGARPDAAALLAGVKPVVVIVVLDALWRFSRSLLRTRKVTLLAFLAAVAAALGANELAVLLVAGLASAALRARPGAARATAAPLLLPLAAGAAGAAPASAGGLFLVFLKIGSVLYGSGYVLLAFLRADLVLRLRWLTDAQLLDAVAIGQVTPGPVFSTATFVGYLVAGGAGAAAATIGIFLPAFVLVAASGPLVPRLRASPVAGAFLDGVNAASLALMAVVTAYLAADAFTGPLSLLVGAAAAVLLFGFRVGPAWLVVGGAATGWLAYLLR